MSRRALVGRPAVNNVARPATRRFAIVVESQLSFAPVVLDECVASASLGARPISSHARYAWRHVAGVTAALRPWKAASKRRRRVPPCAVADEPQCNPCPRIGGGAPCFCLRRVAVPQAQASERASRSSSDPCRDYPLALDLGPPIRRRRRRRPRREDAAGVAAAADAGACAFEGGTPVPSEELARAARLASARRRSAARAKKAAKEASGPRQRLAAGPPRRSPIVSSKKQDPLQ